MSHVKLPDIPFDQLALEPLEGETPSAPVTGRAKFSANTRDGKDRRQGEDRRAAVRFEKDRRQTPDRRPRQAKAWDKGPC